MFLLMMTMSVIPVMVAMMVFWGCREREDAILTNVPDTGKFENRSRQTQATLWNRWDIISNIDSIEGIVVEWCSWLESQHCVRTALNVTGEDVRRDIKT